MASWEAVLPNVVTKDQKLLLSSLQFREVRQKTWTQKKESQSFSPHVKLEVTSAYCSGNYNPTEIREAKLGSYYTAFYQ